MHSASVKDRTMKKTVKFLLSRSLYPSVGGRKHNVQREEMLTNNGSISDPGNVMKKRAGWLKLEPWSRSGWSPSSHFHLHHTGGPGRCRRQVDAPGEE